MSFCIIYASILSKDVINLFRCALSPRQSGLQISAPLSFKTSCNPVLCYFFSVMLCFNHIYIIIYLIVFVLYCLLLLSLTFLVIQPLGCEGYQ